MPRNAATKEASPERGDSPPTNDPLQDSGDGDAARRSEYLGPQPEWSDTEQVVRLWSPDETSEVQITLNPTVDSGFFLDGQTWTCYRRNYFQINASFALTRTDTQEALLITDEQRQSDPPKPIALIENTVGGGRTPIFGFLVGISVIVQGTNREGIHLLQFTGKRERGDQTIPEPLACEPLPSVSVSGPALVQTIDEEGNVTNHNNPAVALFPRLQFNSSTQKGRTQEYYQLRVELYADIGSENLYAIAQSLSPSLVVRGRGPGHYQNKPAIYDGSSRQRTTRMVAETNMSNPPAPGARQGDAAASRGRKRAISQDEHSLTTDGMPLPTGQEMFSSPESPEDLSMLTHQAFPGVIYPDGMNRGAAVDNAPMMQHGSYGSFYSIPVAVDASEETRWVIRCASWIKYMCNALNANRVADIIGTLPAEFQWTTHAPLTFPWSGESATSSEASGRFLALLAALPSARMHLERVWLAKPHVMAFHSPVAGESTASHDEGTLVCGESEIMATVILSYAVAGSSERGKVAVLQTYGSWRDYTGEGNRTDPGSPNRSKKVRKGAEGSRIAESTLPGDFLVPARLEEWFDTYSMAETLAPSNETEEA